MQTYGDLGEVSTLKQISLMWNVPEEVFAKQAHNLVAMREKEQALRVMLDGWALSSKLLLWERFREQVEKVIVQWEAPQRFLVNPDVPSGTMIRICTEVTARAGHVHLY